MELTTKSACTPIVIMQRVGSAFQNLKDQNEELARDLAEREADLEELTNLVSTKDEVIKNAERRLLQAKKLIADLKAEVQSLRSRNDQQEPEQQTAQQQSEAEIGRVNSHSLSSIHSRYVKVLHIVPTYYRQVTDILPTHHQLLADCRSFVSRLLAD